VVEVWPENVPVFELFQGVMTQWRHGFAGPTGLDYGAVLALMEIRQVPHDQRARLMTDLQVMELAALSAIRQAN
jgi:hypothetical protein